MIGSDAGSSLAAHTGSRRAAVRCADGTRRQSPPPPSTARLSSAVSDRSADRRRSCACAIWLRLWIDAVALGHGPQALLTTLYRSTDCLCRSGGAMKNLAQSASLHAGENNAPSKPGTKHLEPDPKGCCAAVDCVIHGNGIHRHGER